MLYLVCDMKAYSIRFDWCAKLAFYLKPISRIVYYCKCVNKVFC